MSAKARARRWVIFGTLATIVASPLLMIVSGQSALYGLWLAVMMAVLWIGQRLTRREVGLVAGDGRSYLVALAYVVGIIGVVVAGAWAAGLIDLAHFSAATVARRISLNFAVTFVLTLLTE